MKNNKEIFHNVQNYKEMLSLIQEYQRKHQASTDTEDRCFMWIDRKEQSQLRPRCNGVDDDGRLCRAIVADKNMLCRKHTNQKIAYFNA